MERALFAYERLMLAGGRPYTVMLAARLSEPPDPSSLRRALDWLQGRHPALRAAIVERNGRPCFVSPSGIPPLPVRTVDRSSPEDWFAELRRELDQPLPRAQGPLCRLVWLRGEAENELILIVDHVICDGQSALILSRDLVARLLDPDAARPTPPGFASLDELLGPVTRRADVAGRAVALAVRSVLRAYAPLPRRDRRCRPAPSYVLSWQIDETLTRCLAETARREQVTVHAALATAFLRAVLAAGTPVVPNRLVCPVDPRPFLAIPRTADLLFPTPSQVSLSLDRSIDGQFWPQARRLGARFLADYVRLRPDRVARLAERLHDRVDHAVDIALTRRRRPDLAFSHLAGADLPHAPGRETQVLAQLASLPWSGSSAIMSAASNGRLCFCLISRETVMPRADAERLRDHAMALIEAL